MVYAFLVWFQKCFKLYFWLKLHWKPFWCDSVLLLLLIIYIYWQKIPRMSAWGTSYRRTPRSGPFTLSLRMKTHVCFLQKDSFLVFTWHFQVLLTLLGELQKSSSEGPRGARTLFLQSVSVHHTHSFKFSMFDLDVTFETKRPVDIKEALCGTF